MRFVLLRLISLLVVSRRIVQTFSSPCILANSSRFPSKKKRYWFLPFITNAQAVFKDDKMPFLTMPTATYEIFMRFRRILLTGREMPITAFTLNQKKFPNIATTLRCSSMTQCRCALKQIMNETLK